MHTPCMCHFLEPPLTSCPSFAFLFNLHAIFNRLFSTKMLIISYYALASLSRIDSMHPRCLCNFYLIHFRPFGQSQGKNRWFFGVFEDIIIAFWDCLTFRAPFYKSQFELGHFCKNNGSIQSWLNQQLLTTINVDYYSLPQIKEVLGGFVPGFGLTLNKIVQTPKATLSI